MQRSQTGLPWLVLALLASACSSAADALEPRRVTEPEGAPLAAFAVPAGKLQVYLFVTTDCPIANSYAPWITTFAREHRGGPVQVALVHVDPDLDAAHARQHARDYELDVPILLDPDQVLARAVGATVTPTAAVLSPRGLEYLGRIDDRWPKRGVDGQVAAHHDLQDALQALQTGQPVPHPRTEAIGCRLPQRAP